ncbi:hypothetical protein ACLBWS_10505 [Brucellaceae bacterium D45D]
MPYFTLAYNKDNPYSRLGSLQGVVSRANFKKLQFISQPIIKALCVAYIRKANFYCKSQQINGHKFLARRFDRMAELQHVFQKREPPPQGNQFTGLISDPASMG